MPRPRNPHMGHPYRRGLVVEQDSSEHILACEQRIVLCPTGARIERPEFGWPWPVLETAPLDPTPLERALQKFEPRGEANVSEHADLIDQSIRHFDAEISVIGRSVPASNEPSFPLVSTPEVLMGDGKADLGDWLGWVGRDGYWIPGFGATNNSAGTVVQNMLPATIAVLGGAGFYTWFTPSATDENVRHLWTPDGTQRQVGCAYSSGDTLTIRIEFLEGYNGIVSAYVFDPDAARYETLALEGQLADFSTGFANGGWAFWGINLPAGYVATLEGKRTSGSSNVAVSGIFLGGSWT